MPPISSVGHKRFWFTVSIGCLVANAQIWLFVFIASGVNEVLILRVALPNVYDNGQTRNSLGESL